MLLCSCYDVLVFAKMLLLLWLLQCSVACYSTVARMMLVVAWAFLWYSRWLPGRCYVDADKVLACYCAFAMVFLVAAWEFLFSCC